MSNDKPVVNMTNTAPSTARSIGAPANGTRNNKAGANRRESLACRNEYPERPLRVKGWNLVDGNMG